MQIILFDIFLYHAFLKDDVHSNSFLLEQRQSNHYIFSKKKKGLTLWPNGPKIIIIISHKQCLGQVHVDRNEYTFNLPLLEFKKV